VIIDKNHNVIVYFNKTQLGRDFEEVYKFCKNQTELHRTGRGEYLSIMDFHTYNGLRALMDELNVEYTLV
jgi:hypothetical protein